MTGRSRPEHPTSDARNRQALTKLDFEGRKKALDLVLADGNAALRSSLSVFRMAIGAGYMTGWQNTTSHRRASREKEY